MGPRNKTRAQHQSIVACVSSGLPAEKAGKEALLFRLGGRGRLRLIRLHGGSDGRLGIGLLFRRLDLSVKRFGDFRDYFFTRCINIGGLCDLFDGVGFRLFALDLDGNLRVFLLGLIVDGDFEGRFF